MALACGDEARRDVEGQTSVPTRNHRAARRAQNMATPPSAQLTEANRAVLPFESSTRRHAASLLSSTRRSRTAGSRKTRSVSSRSCR